MDWKSLLGGIAPVLSGVLTVAGGPVGALGGAALTAVSNAILGHPNGTPDQVAQAIQAGLPPDAVVKLQQADNDFKLSMEQQITAQLAQHVQNAADINTTMQTEAKADNWPTYTWRPFIGFCFGIAWLGVYLVLPILKGYIPGIVQPSIPSEAWIAIGSILGVASWFRGKMQADPNVPSDNRG